MMTAKEIRDSFKSFFESKGHQIVPSAPMVIKDDPTLMFTNAGMNQFKDIILGNHPAKNKRVADSQKCLRVSGKHNDLEEVGHDTYHHTMFEMLGNWSFGDYFKKEAISWAWEYLVDVLKIDPKDLYATVFEGSPEEGLERDNEAAGYWEQFLPKDHILNGNKHDNFWEMGDTGPCGPCSEIHIDSRSEEEKAQLPGNQLVNKDHPQVIEIWNLVFMQFNRKADGSLEGLPAKVIDTGMGFERLVRTLQGKTSNYDTDVFQPIIKAIAEMAGTAYGQDNQKDIAMRVIADHIRTIAFSITDGQLPSNAKAGYVIRRILRRAVRYGYTFLGQKQAFMYKLLPVLIENMGEAYPELNAQKTLIEKVIKEEEESFLRTLETGIRLLDKVMNDIKSPFTAIMGGSKVSTKIEIIENLLTKVDNLILAGGMTYTFMKAMGGTVGTSICEEDKLDLALDIMKKAKENGVNLVLAVDTKVGDAFSNDANTKIVPSKEIPDGWEGMDIGPKSEELFANVIKGSKTILWNGPTGVFEFDNFSHGSRAVGEAIVEATKNGAFSLVGGGDSVACVNKFGLASGVSYVSTGGGALLEAIEGKVLPGIAAIKG